MNKKQLKKRNINNILKGYFFEAISFSLIAFFLPYYLKEKGLNILEIGAIFTLTIGIGSLIYSLIFSKILKKIKLKTGLIFSGILSVIKNLTIFSFPTTAGATTAKFITETHGLTQGISVDVSLQHNNQKNDEKNTASKYLISASTGIAIGIILSLIIINKIGFKFAFLSFSIISMISLIFYSRVTDKTRFKIKKKKYKIKKLNKKLKFTIISGLLYGLALQSSFALIITFLVKERFSDSITFLGLIFLMLYFSMSLTTILSKKYLNKIQPSKTAIIGMMILLISAIIIISSQNKYLVLFSFLIEGIGAGIWEPSQNSLQWKFTEKENRENISGYISGLNSITKAVGPLFGAILVTKIGITAPFIFKATISLICIGIYFYIKKLEKTQ